MSSLSKLLGHLLMDVLLSLVVAACFVLLIGDVAPQVTFLHLWLAAFGVRQITGS